MAALARAARSMVRPAALSTRSSAAQPRLPASSRSSATSSTGALCVTPATAGASSSHGQRRCSRFGASAERSPVSSKNRQTRSGPSSSAHERITCCSPKQSRTFTGAARTTLPVGSRQGTRYQSSPKVVPKPATATRARSSGALPRSPNQTAASSSCHHREAACPAKRAGVGSTRAACGASSPRAPSAGASPAATSNAYQSRWPPGYSVASSCSSRPSPTPAATWKRYSMCCGSQARVPGAGSAHQSGVPGPPRVEHRPQRTGAGQALHHRTPTREVGEHRAGVGGAPGQQRELGAADRVEPVVGAEPQREGAHEAVEQRRRGAAGDQRPAQLQSGLGGEAQRGRPRAHGLALDRRLQRQAEAVRHRPASVRRSEPDA